MMSKLAFGLRVVVTSVTSVFVALARIAGGRGGASAVVLKVGDQAPDFSLPGSDGREHRLRDYMGRTVVLVWYPRAFTGGCTVQCRSLAVDAAAWRPFAAEVLAISVDTVSRTTAFARAIGIGLPILADVTGEVARRYGVLGRAGFPSRWTFYIGADGRILEVDRQVNPASYAEDIAAHLTCLGVPRRS
jgi:peroxiredoxin Q/BCP